MKKIFLSFTLLLFTIAGFSQQKQKAVVEQTKPVQIDSLVTVSLPSAFQKKDTLTQQIYSANSLYGFITVIRTANEKNNTPLKKENDLNKVLNDYIKKIQSQATDGRALRVRDTTIGTLKAKNFTLKSDDGAGNMQIINFTLIYTRDATYTLEYVYPEIRSDLVKGEYKAFISSIKLSHELQRDDQYLLKDNGMSSTTKIGIFGGGALVVILIIVLIVRRRKKLAVS
jgi:hypothetical protein